LILILSADRRLDGHDNFSTQPVRNSAERRGPHGRRHVALARYLGHQNLLRLFLRGLGNEVKLFCSPSAMETVNGEWATTVQFGRRLVTMKAASGKTSALGMALEVAVTTGGPPPSNNLTQEALVRWVDDASLLGNGDSGLVLPRGCRGRVYIGVSSYRAVQGFLASAISILKIE
jgi:hypothetical protein